MPVFTEVNLVTAAAVFVLGLLAGALLARLVLPSRQKLRQLMLELDAARSEHQVYRSEVSHHFEKTSELVAALTASYKAVYDHLADGAQSLCSENAALGAGRFAAPRLVFDQDVSVGRLEGGESATTHPAESAREASPTREEGPVLEMTREATTRGERTEPLLATPVRSPDDDREEGTDRSPLH
jgi:uncharacterized membrane-anchored protein YhcB (DUF1043 family)